MIARISRSRDVFPDDVHVAVSTGGAAVAWWDESETEESGICDEVGGSSSYVAYAGPAGAWGRPHRLSRFACGDAENAVAIGARGNVNAVYGTPSGIRFVRRVVGRGWAAPRIVTSSPVRPGDSSLQMVRSPRGGTVVVSWSGRVPGHPEGGFLARRRIDGRWAPVRTWKLWTPHTEAEGWGWKAAMDRHGNTALIWLAPDRSIHVKWWPRGRPLRQGRTLVGPIRHLRNQSREFDASVGLNGDTVVAYADNARHGVHMLHRPRGGTWLREEVISEPLSASNLAVSVRGSGDVDALWEATDFGAATVNSSNIRLRYSRLTRH